MPLASTRLSCRWTVAGCLPSARAMSAAVARPSLARNGRSARWLSGSASRAAAWADPVASGPANARTAACCARLSTLSRQEPPLACSLVHRAVWYFRRPSISFSREMTFRLKSSREGVMTVSMRSRLLAASSTVTISGISASAGGDFLTPVHFAVHGHERQAHLLRVADQVGGDPGDAGGQQPLPPGGQGGGVDAQHLGRIRPAQPRGDLQDVDQGEVLLAEFHHVSFLSMHETCTEPAIHAFFPALRRL